MNARHAVLAGCVPAALLAAALFDHRAAAVLTLLAVLGVWLTLARQPAGTAAVGTAARRGRGWMPDEPPAPPADLDGPHWVYLFRLARPMVVDGELLAPAGAPGYVGRTSQDDPAERWEDDNHPAQQDWGRFWLDTISPEVWEVDTWAESEALEERMIRELAEGGCRLFNIEHTYPDERLPRLVPA